MGPIEENSRLMLNVSEGRSVSLDLNELELAVDFVSSSGAFEHYAYLDKESGKIYFDSDASEDELPEDLESNTKYIIIPSKQELGLGKRLALDFTREYLPDDLDEVYSHFSRRGAYSKFKGLLQSRGCIDQWYEYEQKAFVSQIKRWCSENEISF